MAKERVREDEVKQPEVKAVEETKVERPTEPAKEEQVTPRPSDRPSPEQVAKEFEDIKALIVRSSPKEWVKYRMYNHALTTLANAEKAVQAYIRVQ
jgi:hypothetical protein